MHALTVNRHLNPTTIRKFGSTILTSFTVRCAEVTQSRVKLLLALFVHFHRRGIKVPDSAI